MLAILVFAIKYAPGSDMEEIVFRFGDGGWGVWSRPGPGIVGSGGNAEQVDSIAGPWPHLPLQANAGVVEVWPGGGSAPVPIDGTDDPGDTSMWRVRIDEANNEIYTFECCGGAIGGGTYVHRDETGAPIGHLLVPAAHDVPMPDRWLNNCYTNWAYPGAGPYAAFRCSVRLVANDPHPMQGYFWSNTFTFVGGNGGYVGIQSKGSIPTDGDDHKIAIFSIFSGDEPGSTINFDQMSASGPGWAGTFGGEGVGYSVRIEYEWVIGATYLFRVEEVEPHVWGAWIQTFDFLGEIFIGQITVPAAWGGLDNATTSFTEFFSPPMPLAACSDYIRVGAVFGQPSLDSDYSDSHTNTVTNGAIPIGEVACPDATAEDYSSDVIHYLGYRPPDGLSRYANESFGVAARRAVLAVTDYPDYNFDHSQGTLIDYDVDTDVVAQEVALADTFPGLLVSGHVDTKLYPIDVGIRRLGGVAVAATQRSLVVGVNHYWLTLVTLSDDLASIVGSLTMEVTTDPDVDSPVAFTPVFFDNYNDGWWLTDRGIGEGPYGVGPGNLWFVSANTFEMTGPFRIPNLEAGWTVGIPIAGGAAGGNVVMIPIAIVPHEAPPID